MTIRSGPGLNPGVQTSKAYDYGTERGIPVMGP